VNDFPILYLYIRRLQTYFLFFISDIYGFANSSWVKFSHVAL
jgi:hypothetical protein